MSGNGDDEGQLADCVCNWNEWLFSLTLFLFGMLFVMFLLLVYFIRKSRLLTKIGYEPGNVRVPTTKKKPAVKTAEPLDAGNGAKPGFLRRTVLRSLSNTKTANSRSAITAKNIENAVGMPYSDDFTNATIATLQSPGSPSPPNVTARAIPSNVGQTPAAEKGKALDAKDKIVLPRVSKATPLANEYEMIGNFEKSLMMQPKPTPSPPTAPAAAKAQAQKIVGPKKKIHQYETLAGLTMPTKKKEEADAKKERKESLPEKSKSEKKKEKALKPAEEAKAGAKEIAEEKGKTSKMKENGEDKPKTKENATAKKEKSKREEPPKEQSEPKKKKESESKKKKIEKAKIAEEGRKIKPDADKGSSESDDLKGGKLSSDLEDESADEKLVSPPPVKAPKVATKATADKTASRRVDTAKLVESSSKKPAKASSSSGKIKDGSSSGKKKRGSSKKESSPDAKKSHSTPAIQEDTHGV